MSADKDISELIKNQITKLQLRLEAIEHPIELKTDMEWQPIIDVCAERMDISIIMT
jgi:hypothetical protein